MGVRKILVTGGSALVGTAVSAVKGEFEGLEFSFIGKEACDLTNSESTLDYVASVRPDSIIHLAAVSGGVGLSKNRPALLLHNNVKMTLNVLEAARRCDVAKTVMTLSSGMYPDGLDKPLAEGDIHQGPPHESNYSYAFAKRLVEVAIRANRTEHGLNVIGVIPNGIFGPNDKFAYEDASMLPSLIRRFYEGRDQAEIVVWGDGNPLREYTYAKDIARATVWCLLNYDDEEPLNIGTTEERSVREIANMVAECLGISKDRLKFDTSKPSGVYRKSTDNSKFVAMSSFEFTPFFEGLSETIAWFAETYEMRPELLKLGPSFVQPNIT